MLYLLCVISDCFVIYNDACSVMKERNDGGPTECPVSFLQVAAAKPARRST
jgi:hypothetical protein